MSKPQSLGRRGGCRLICEAPRPPGHVLGPSGLPFISHCAPQGKSLNCLIRTAVTALRSLLPGGRPPR